jgi:hypothetical protein
MPDPEVQWIPAEAAQVAAVRTRAISVAVFAASCVLLGIVIGRLTAGIPAVTRSGTLDVAGVSNEKKATAPNVERPSLALKSDTEMNAQKAPSTQTGPETVRRPFVLLNPGAADKTPPSGAGRSAHASGTVG